MDIFQRSIHSNVKDLGDGRYLVTSQLLDLEHSLHLELVVRTENGEIEEATASMSKTPFGKCLKAAEGVSQLVGLKVGRGVMRQVGDLLGGARGCAHMVELITDAVRLIAMLLVGGDKGGKGYWDADKRDMTEEEVIEETRQFLKNSCLVYAEEE
jgi:hypothetical protein